MPTAKEPELSLFGMYAEYLEKPDSGANDGGLTVPDIYASSKDLLLLEQNIGINISREEFVFLYKAVLSTIMAQLKNKDEPEAFGDVNLMKKLLVNLTPTIIRDYAKESFSKGEIKENLLSLALKVAIFCEENYSFSMILVEACLNDARIKTIQEEVQHSSEIQLPQASGLN